MNKRVNTKEKGGKKWRIQKQKIDGITLVALVVTIVVLLILAGITITYVMGDNSVFKQATKSKAQTEIAKIEERAQLIYSDKLMENASSNMKIKVETSQVIEQLKTEGYTIKQIAVSAEDITGISLDKENMTIGKSKTAEIKVTYEGVEEPFIYYVEVQGKYYQMHSTKGFITINREPSNLTKEDFEAENGEGSTTTLTVVSSETEIAIASVRAGSNNIIEVTSTETEGETVVTVTYGSYTKTCTVKVVEPVLATGITLNETEYVVTGGESWIHDKQLVATIEPSNVTEKEVTWKSSNPEVATVDENGLVKAGTKGRRSNHNSNNKRRK